MFLAFWKYFDYLCSLIQTIKTSLFKLFQENNTKIKFFESMKTYEDMTCKKNIFSDSKFVYNCSTASLIPINVLSDLRFYNKMENWSKIHYLFESEIIIAFNCEFCIKK